MKRHILTFIMVAGMLEFVAAQSLASHRFEERSLSIGTGITNMLDTYLSPLYYEGAHLVLMSESFSQTRAANGRWYVQSLFALHADYATPTSGSGLTVGGMADYSHTYYYKVATKGERFCFYAGPQGQLRIGGIYNLRNSNNPAQLKLGANIAASAMAKYAFTGWEIPMNIRLQADLPLLGIAFGPDYGQSYYEIFYLGQRKGCIHFTNPGNNPSLRSIATYDILLSSCTLRFTLVNDLYQWKLGNQHYHMFTHSVMLGYVKNLYRVTRDEETKQYIPY